MTEEQKRKSLISAAVAGTATGLLYNFINKIPVAQQSSGKKLKVFSDPYLIERRKFDGKISNIGMRGVKSIANTADTIGGIWDIPPGTVVINNTDKNLYDLADNPDLPRKKDFIVVNNPTNELKYRDLFYNHSAFKDISIPTVNFSSYANSKLGKNYTIGDLTKLLQTEANNIFIKSREIKDKVAKGTATHFLTGIDQSRYNIQPALTALFNYPEEYVVQSNLPQASDKIRVHVSSKGVFPIAYDKTKKIKVEEHISKDFLNKLVAAHSKYTGDPNVITAYDIIKSGDDHKVLNATNNLLKDSSTRAADLAHQLGLQKIKAGTIGVVLAAAGLAAIAPLMRKEAALEEDTKDKLRTVIPGIAGVGTGAAILYNLRNPKYSKEYPIKKIQAEARGGKIRVIGYKPRTLGDKLLNLIVAPDIKFYDYYKPGSEGHGVLRFPNIDPKNPLPRDKRLPVKGVLYVGQGRRYATGLDPDVGINMYPHNQMVRQILAKDRIGQHKIFKGLALKHKLLSDILPDYGITEEQFAKMSEDEVKEVFKAIDKRGGVGKYIKPANSSGFHGIYGPLKTIHSHQVQDILGEKVTKRLGFFKSNIPEIKKNPKEFLISNLLPEGKEYRVHFLNGKFVSASDRFSKNALENWIQDKSKLGFDITDIENAIGSLQRRIYSGLDNSKKYVKNDHRLAVKYLGADVWVPDDKTLKPLLVEVNSSARTLGKYIQTVPEKDLAKAIAAQDEVLSPIGKAVFKAKANIADIKWSHAALKDFMQNLTGKKEFLIPAIAKAAVPAAAVGLGMHYLLKEKDDGKKS